MENQHQLDIQFDFRAYVENGIPNRIAAFNTYARTLRLTCRLQLYQPAFRETLRITYNREADARPIDFLGATGAFFSSYFVTQFNMVALPHSRVVIHYLWADLACFHNMWATRSGRFVTTDRTLVTNIAHTLQEKIRKAIVDLSQRRWQCRNCPRRFAHISHCGHFINHSGIHKCICGEKIHSHNEFVKHILPSSQAMDPPGDYTLDYLCINDTCHVALFYLIVLSAYRCERLDEEDSSPFAYLCSCGEYYEGVVLWLWHLADCMFVKNWMRVACPFCPRFYGPLEIQAVDQYYFDIGHYTTIQPVGRYWRDFYIYFMKGSNPSKILKYLDMYEGIIRMTLFEVPFRPNELEDNVKVQEEFETVFEHRLTDLDTRFKAFPHVCTACHVRTNASGDHENGHPCFGPNHNIHVCRCGILIENHWDYWLHTLVACKFYTSTHLMLFILSGNSGFIFCRCLLRLKVTSLDEMMIHFLNCQYFLRYMLIHCPFCTEEFKNDPAMPTHNFPRELRKRINPIRGKPSLAVMRRLQFVINDSIGIPSLISTPPPPAAFDFLDDIPVIVPEWMEKAIISLRRNLLYLEFSIGNNDYYIIDVEAHLFLGNRRYIIRDYREPGGIYNEEVEICKEILREQLLENIEHIALQ